MFLLTSNNNFLPGKVAANDIMILAANLLGSSVPSKVASSDNLILAANLLNLPGNFAAIKWQLFWMWGKFSCKHI